MKLLINRTIFLFVFGVFISINTALPLLSQEDNNQNDSNQNDNNRNHIQSSPEDSSIILPSIIINNGDPFISDKNVDFPDRGVHHYQDILKINPHDNSLSTYVNLAYGNLIHQREDLNIPDIAFPVKLVFTYNSGSSIRGRYGNGWQMNYGLRYVTNNQTENVIIVYPDDKTEIFIKKRSGVFSATYGCGDSLVEIEGGYKLIMWDDKYNNNANNNYYNKPNNKSNNFSNESNGYGDYSEYYFDSPNHHYVTKIAGRNGLELTFEYDEESQLAGIGYPSGRRISFQYTGGYLQKAELTDALESESLELEYVYDKFNNLSEVKYQDGSSIKYEYYPDCFGLKSITDKNNNRFEYGYNDFNSVESVSYSGAGAIISFAYDTAGRRVDVFAKDSLYKSFYYDGKDRIYKIVDKNNDSLARRWNARYQMVSETDGKGYITLYEYDNRNNITKITDPAQNTKLYRWNTEYNKIAGITDERNNATLYYYDANGNAELIEDAAGNAASLAYYDNGLIAQYYDKQNNLTLFQYDANGNMIKLIDAESNEYFYEYDGAGNCTRFVDPKGYGYDFNYNASGWLGSVRAPGGGAKLFGWDKAGNLIWKTDWKGSITKYEYANNYLSSVVYANEAEINILHGGFGRPEVLIDWQNNSTVFRFDALGRLIELKKENGDLIKYGYDMNGNINSVYNDRRRWEFNYDKLNRLAISTAPIGFPVYFDYGPAGSLILETDRNGYETKYEYDYLGRINKIIEMPFLTTNIEYDKAGNIIAISDTNNIRYGFDYNSLNKLVRINDPMSNIYLYKYDDNGNLIKYTGPLQNSYLFDYDNQNRLVSFQNSDNTMTYRSYDANDNIISVLKPDSSYLECDYDAMDNLLSAASGGNTKTYRYDKGNRLIKFTDVMNNSYSFVHDSSGNLKKIINPLLSETEYAYDAEGNLSAAINSSLKDIRLQYDNSDRIKEIVGAMDNRVGFDYDLNGNIISVINAAGTNYILKYDNQNRLILKSIENLEDKFTSYNYNLSGNIIRKIDAKLNPTDYTYDKLGRLAEMKNALGDSLLFDYNGIGKLMRIEDYGGFAAVFDYDGGNRVASIINSLGHSIYYNYDKAGRVISRTDENSNSTNYFYDNFGNLRKIITPANTRHYFEYDKKGNMLLYVNPSNDSAAFTFDKLSRIDSIRYSGGMNYGFGYGQSNEITSIGFPGHTAIEFAYDPLNRLGAIYYPDSSATYIGYDVNSNIDTIIHPRQNRTILNYDEFDNLTEIIMARDEFIKFRYDILDNVTARIDANSDETTFDYNELNLITRVKHKYGVPKYFSYNSFGDLLAITNENGGKQAIEYDKLRRITRIYDDSSSFYKYVYNENGGLLGKTNKNNFTKGFIYDSLRRLIYIVDSREDFYTLEYDNSGRLSGILSPNQAEYEFEYNTAGYVDKITNPTKNYAQIDYDSSGRISAFANGNNKFRLNYNPENKVTSILNPLNLRLNFGYDTDGNLINLTDWGNQQYRFSYDSRNRCSGVSGPLNSYNYYFGPAGDLTLQVVNLTDNVRYNYNRRNRLFNSVYSDNLGVLYYYINSGELYEVDNTTLSIDRSVFYRDEFGRIDSLIVYYGDDFSKKLYYSYDNEGNCTEMRTKSGGIASYSYNEHNDIVTLGYGNTETKFYYDGAGNIVQIEYPNGVVAAARQDSSNKVLNLTYTKGDDVLFGEDYVYEPGGYLSTATDNQGKSFEFRYDVLGRLDFFRRGTDDSTAIEYDANGNRIKVINNNNENESAYNNENMLTNYSDKFFDYDGRGNLISVAENDLLTEYEYDGDNNLIAVKQNDSVIFELIYSYDKSLIGTKSQRNAFFLNSKITTISGNNSSRNNRNRNNSSRNRNNSAQIIVEYGHNFEPVRKYNYAVFPGMSRPQIISFYDFTSGRTYYVHNDATGNTRLITSESGEVISRFLTGAFGNSIIKDDTLNFKFFYAGMIWIEQLKMYYDGQRFYNPELGRYLQKDPNFMANSTNQYIRNNNNPLQFNRGNLLNEPRLNLNLLAKRNNPKKIMQPEDFELNSDGLITEFIESKLRKQFKDFAFYGLKQLVEFDYKHSDQCGRSAGFDNFKTIDNYFIRFNRQVRPFQRKPVAKLAFTPLLPADLYEENLFKNNTFNYWEFIFDNPRPSFNFKGFDYDSRSKSIKPDHSVISEINLLNPKLLVLRVCIHDPGQNNLAQINDFGFLGLDEKNSIANVYRKNFPRKNFLRKNVPPQTRKWDSRIKASSPLELIHENINPKYDKFDKIIDMLTFAETVRDGGVYDLITKRHLAKYGLKSDWNVTWAPGINIGSYIPNYRIATDIREYNAVVRENEIEYLLHTRPLAAMPGTSSYKSPDELKSLGNPQYSNYPSIYPKRRIIEIPDLSK